MKTLESRMMFSLESAFLFMTRTFLRQKRSKIVHWKFSNGRRAGAGVLGCKVVTWISIFSTFDFCPCALQVSPHDHLCAHWHLCAHLGPRSEPFLTARIGKIPDTNNEEARALAKLRVTRTRDRCWTGSPHLDLLRLTPL